MSILGIVAGILAVAVLVVAFQKGAMRASRWRLLAAGALVVASVPVLSVISQHRVEAAIVAGVPLGTAGGFSVLGGQTVTNTGETLLAAKLGLFPGTSITGFPPGVAIGSTEIDNGPAQLAQSDLDVAYVNAAGRPVNANVPTNLGGQTLVGGVYATDNGELGLTGTLVLDGANDLNSVFIFQAASTLITSGASNVLLINGAQQCNVFWQVGSSATLGGASSFSGTIMALTSITVGANVTVAGRALARNGAVTLESDSFVNPTCEQGPPTTTTTTTVLPTTTTTVLPTTSTTILPTTTTTIVPTTTTVLPTTTTTILPTTTTMLPTTTTVQPTSSDTTSTTILPTTTTVQPTSSDTTSTTILTTITTGPDTTSSLGSDTTLAASETSVQPEVTLSETDTTQLEGVTIPNGAATTTTQPAGDAGTTTMVPQRPVTTVGPGITLPHTGQSVGGSLGLAIAALVLGLIALVAARRRSTPTID